MQRSSHNATSHVIALFALLSAPAGWAEDRSNAVVGRADPTIDVPAVQQAVDRGGIVVLKGRFDFGDTGSVKIANDVSVRGELDERGAPRTVIRGGYRTFESVPPASMPMPAGPKIEIANIHFEAAWWTPLWLAHASGVTSARNRITGVRPHSSPERPQTGLQQGILIGTTFPGDSHRFDPVHLHHYLGRRQTKVRIADFRLTFGQIAVSIFNNSEEAKRFNSAPGDEPGGS